MLCYVPKLQHEEASRLSAATELSVAVFFWGGAIFRGRLSVLCQDLTAIRIAKRGKEHVGLGLTPFRGMEMGKATGPRTTQGKARSSKNAAKHWIESGRILEREEQDAAILRNGFIQDFKPQGLIEYEVIDDLVFNRLVKRRIDAAFTREFSKAFVQKTLDWMDKNEQTPVQYWMRSTTIDNRSRRAGKSSERLRPDLCISALQNLKARVATHGLQPDQDLAAVRCIFGDQPTEHAALIIARLMDVAQAPTEEGAPAETAERDAPLKSTLEALEAEIERQKLREEISQRFEDCELASEIQEPCAPVLDRLLRYRAANAREFKHLLSSLESIRRLRASAA